MAFDHNEKSQSSEADIRAGIGNLDDFQIYGPQILIGIYMRPGKTQGGILLPDKTVDEDRWQNKVGVVLKKGPLAFQSDDQHDFGGLAVDVGQWVVCRTADGMPIDIRGVHCRLVEDTNVKMTVLDPTDIY